MESIPNAWNMHMFHTSCSMLNQYNVTDSYLKLWTSDGYKTIILWVNSAVHA